MWPRHVARIERSEIRDRPMTTATPPQASLALNPGYGSNQKTVVAATLVVAPLFAACPPATGRPQGSPLQVAFHGTAIDDVQCGSDRRLKIGIRRGAIVGAVQKLPRSVQPRVQIEDIWIDGYAATLLWRANMDKYAGAERPIALGSIHSPRTQPLDGFFSIHRFLSAQSSEAIGWVEGSEPIVERRSCMAVAMTAWMVGTSPRIARGPAFQMS